MDGLSDVRTTPNREATKFRSMDPRARFLKPKPQYDVEMQKLVLEQGVTVQRYEERIEESERSAITRGIEGQQIEERKRED